MEMDYPFGDDVSPVVFRQQCVLPSDRTIRHGPLGEWRENGKRSLAARYENGKVVGRWTVWFSSGKVATVQFFRAGEEHGQFVMYHWNTSRKEVTGQYRHGEPTGRWRFFDRSGKQVGEALYRKDGKLMKQTGNTSTTVEGVP